MEVGGAGAVSMKVRVAGTVIRESSVLLIRHDYPEERPLWHIPGGGVEPAETLTDALEREFREELDLSVQVGALWLVCDSIRLNDQEQVVHFLFDVKLDSGSVPELQADATSGTKFQWISMNKLSRIRVYPNVSEYLHQFIDTYPHLPAIRYIGRIDSA
jgi:8-oxo-dGTP diphosphatase